MNSTTKWTHTGTWASFDHFFWYPSYLGVPIKELPARAREEMREYQNPRGGSRSRSQILRYLEAVLTDSKTISSAEEKLVEKMGPRRFSGFREFYNLLEGPGSDVDFSVDLSDGYIQLTDVGNLANKSKSISDGLMFLAESLKLPIPWELENRWVKQMGDYADRDWNNLFKIANRDGKDQGWIEDTFVSGLEVAGYIPHLTEPHRGDFHITDICKRVAQRRKEISLDPAKVA